MDNPNTLFAQFIPAVTGCASQTFLSGEHLARLTLCTSGRLSVVYAPFDHLLPDADLAIVGITPGRVQAENALSATRDALRAGKTPEEALRIAKLRASFSGTQTRTNLIDLLDEIGLPAFYSLGSSAALFDQSSERVHFTSALRYPVFLDGGNYNGTPHMVRTPILREIIETYLAAEVRALPKALWLPLGPKPALALLHLVKLGILDRNRVLDGLPHPSGLNGERIATFLGRLRPENVSKKTRPDRLLGARDALRAQVAALRLAEATR